jgi:replicative DNA helicase
MSIDMTAASGGEPEREPGDDRDDPAARWPPQTPADAIASIAVPLAELDAIPLPEPDTGGPAADVLARVARGLASATRGGLVDARRARAIVEAAAPTHADALRASAEWRAGIVDRERGAPATAEREPGDKPAPANDAPTAPTVEAILRSPAFARPRRVYPTGFRELDRLLSGAYVDGFPGAGLAARTLTVIAGPTGAGKSGWALGLAVHIARRLKETSPVLYVSTELEGAEVAARVAAQALEAAQRGTEEARHVTPGEILALRISTEEAAGAVAGWPIHVLEWDPWADGPRLPPIEAIGKQALAIRGATGLMPVIVVDYLQHLASEDPDQRRLSVSAVANGLRRLARDLDVPVVALSSVGRQNYKIKKTDDDEVEEDARDYIAAAKESGDIEYACAVFAYLEPGRKVDADGESPARLAVAKCRAGRHGFVGLRFHGPSGLWWDDSASLESMGVAARMAELDEKVLAALSKLKAPMKREAFVDSLGLRKGDVRTSLDRLVVAGKAQEIDGPAPQGGGKRPRLVMLPVATGRQESLC